MTRIIDYLSDAVCTQSLSCSTPKRVRLLQKSTSPVIPTTFSTITNAAAYTRSVARVRSTSSSRLIRIPMQPQAGSTQQMALELGFSFRNVTPCSYLFHFVDRTRPRSALTTSNNTQHFQLDVARD